MSGHDLIKGTIKIYHNSDGNGNNGNNDNSDNSDGNGNNGDGDGCVEYY